MNRIIAFSVILLALLFNANAQQEFASSNLPIIVIETDGHQPIPDEPKIPGTMKVIYHHDGSRNYLSDVNNPQFLDYDGRIMIEIRGYTSQNPEKKPYAVHTVMDDDETNNNVSLLDMPEENDWVLNNLSYDATAMRDFLSYELYEKMGQYSPRRHYCEVVINDDYQGLYMLLEKIKVDKNRVNIEKDFGSYIIKADRSETYNDFAWSEECYNYWDDVVYVYSYPKPDDISYEMKELIYNDFMRFEEAAQNNNSSVSDGYPSMIDVKSFIDYMIIGEFASNVDVYQFSTFFHKDNGGKLRAGPIWDYNLAYGYDEYGNRSGYNVWQFSNYDNEGSKFWTDLFNEPEFRCRFSKRWFELTAEGQPFNYQVVINRIDEIDSVLTESMVRDSDRWFGHEGIYSWYHQYGMQEMKDWIPLRINWMNIAIGSHAACDEVNVPPLVISRIHYHPMDEGDISGKLLEFIQINNNGDEDVNLTGIFFSKLGITYRFPNDSVLAANDSLILASDSLTFKEFYGISPFGQYNRDLSNKDEEIVISDAWGNVIDEVHYYDSEPWPEEADGEGFYLQLIDLNLDNSLAESWTTSFWGAGVEENNVDNQFVVYPNPTNGIIKLKLPEGNHGYCIFDISGRKVAEGNLISEGAEIYIDNLDNGLYILNINGLGYKKVIKVFR